MKIIDLLNKIANGEEVPDGIKWGCHDFRWFVYEYKSTGELSEPTLLDYLAQCPQMLNDEIITFNKTEEDKKIEKIELDDEYIVDYYDGSKHYLNTNRKDRDIYIKKINEIIDYLNSKGE